MQAVVLYASGSRIFTQKTINMLQVFITKCLRRIDNVDWPDKINDKDLLTKLIRN